MAIRYNKIEDYVNIFVYFSGYHQKNLKNSLKR